MKKLFAYISLGILVGCGPNRDFEDKNIFGSQTVSSSAVGGVENQGWPEGKQGVGLLEIIPEDMTWEGYKKNQQTELETIISTSDWYDPTGEKHINAVLVITTKYGCDLCLEQAGSLQDKISVWDDEGKNIKVVFLITNDEEDGSPTPKTALNWKSDNYLIGADVAVDPLSLMLPGPVWAMPYHTIVDPRTMIVLANQQGTIDNYDQLEILASSNK